MNPTIRLIAIVLLVLQVLLSLFLYSMFLSEAFSSFYTGNAKFFHYSALVLNACLGILFAWYCYIKEYFVVYYGILSIFLLLIIASFKPDLAIILLTFGHIIVIGHGVTILVTRARENLWLRAYAILVMAVNVIHVAKDVTSLIQAVLPLLFVFMLLKESKHEKSSNADILDAQ